MTPASALPRIALGSLTAAFLVAPQAFEPLLRPLAPPGAPAVYVRTSLAELAAVHLGVTALATVLSTIVAIALAVFVTRPAGAAFLAPARSLANVGQTFPPVAVLAVAVPAVGFGEAPILIALALYGLLPVFETTLGGLAATPRSVDEAARGAGMSEGERLRLVELPLALPAILSGVRLSAVIGLSTTAIGSTVAARTLGEVIVAGISTDNMAYLVQGAGLTAALAILISDGFRALERRAAIRAGVSGAPQ